MAIKTVDNMNTQLKGTMEKLLTRDDQLDDMMAKTNEMSTVSASISSKSRKVRRWAFLNSISGKLIMVFLVLVLIYAILALACGGVSIPKCR